MAFEKRSAGERMVNRNNKRTGSTSSRGTRKRQKKDVKKGRWSPEEDQKLAELVEAQKRRLKGVDAGDISWDEVEEGFGSRTKKQCRERWISQLDPSLNRGQWTKEEDSLLEELAEQTNRKWATIARKMPGRTENMVKNRYHALERLNGAPKTGTKRKKPSKTSKKQKSKHTEAVLTTPTPRTPAVVGTDSLSDSSKTSDEVHPLSCVTNVGSKLRTNNLVKSDSSTSFDKLASSFFGEMLPSSSIAPLTKVPSFDTFITREVSEPFSDKPDVIQRHPSFDTKAGSSLNLMERQFSTDSALWGKVPTKGSSYDFLTSMNKLEKPSFSFDLKKLDGRQRSFGQVSSSDLDQVFYQEQLEPMMGYNKQ